MVFFNSLPVPESSKVIPAHPCIITNNKAISCSQTSAMQQKCRMAEMDELLKSEMTKIKGFLMYMRFAMFFLKFMLCLIGLQFLIGFDVSFYQY